MDQTDSTSTSNMKNQALGVPTRPTSLFNYCEGHHFPTSDDDFLARRETFTPHNWPKIYDYCGKSADQMAKAGFNKIKHWKACDAVQCFHCLQTIINWTIDDNPFVCHQKFAKNCKWIEAMKENRPDLFQPVKIM